MECFEVLFRENIFVKVVLFLCYLDNWLKKNKMYKWNIGICVLFVFLNIFFKIIRI